MLPQIHRFVLTRFDVPKLFFPRLILFHTIPNCYPHRWLIRKLFTMHSFTFQRRNLSPSALFLILDFYRFFCEEVVVICFKFCDSIHVLHTTFINIKRHSIGYMDEKLFNAFLFSLVLLSLLRNHFIHRTSFSQTFHFNNNC